MVALRFYMNHISSVPVLPKRLMILERCHFTLMMVYCPLESSLENQAVFYVFPLWLFQQSQTICELSAILESFFHDASRGNEAGCDSAATL